MEWSDLDPRFGIRATGGRHATDQEMIETVSHQIDRIKQIIAQGLSEVTVVLSLPSVAPLLFSVNPGWQANMAEMRLSHLIAQFGIWATARSNVRVLSPHRLAAVSPSNTREDVRSEMVSGFPYRVDHAAHLGDLLTRLISPPSPKKGLITDLDNTLWKGIVGEDGSDGISWTLERHSHLHGVYQHLLSALMQAGILVGIASKNSRTLVDQAFERRDLIIDRQGIFPIEVNWNPKSASIRQILRLWNVAPDAVVFVDDSPMEIAEVQNAFPGITCLLFPGDSNNFVDFSRQLHDLFAKGFTSEEDGLRVSSVRHQAAMLEGLDDPGRSPDAFLQGADAEITFAEHKNPSDARTFALINKTNQFNLNGLRYTEAEWRDYVSAPNTRVLTVSYKDKYAALGTISVMGVTVDNNTIVINVWVLSCRAFSRRIEHQCIRYLFNRFDADTLRFQFKVTGRNMPLQEFLTDISGTTSETECTLSRSRFEHACPALFHRVNINPQ